MLLESLLVVSASAAVHSPNAWRDMFKKITEFTDSDPDHLIRDLLMVTSEAHVESTQQTVCVNEMGGLFCAGGADPFGVGISDHAAVGSFVRPWSVVGERINL